MQEDWFMRQIELAGKGIAMLFNKELSAIELGEVESQDGQMVLREELLSTYLKTRDYQAAFLLVNSLKYKLAVVDYQVVSEAFIEHLKKELIRDPNSIKLERLEHYQKILRELL